MVMKFKFNPNVGRFELKICSSVQMSMAGVQKIVFVFGKFPKTLPPNVPSSNVSMPVGECKQFLHHIRWVIVTPPLLLPYNP
jgi:hypothetical protein